MTDATYPAPSTSPATGSRPSVLNTAFWLYLGSIVVGVVATLLTIPQTQAQVAALGTSSASSAGGLVVVSAIVGALIGAVIWGLFLFFLRRDQGWARWVLLVLTVLGLLRVLQGFGVGALGEVLAIVAAVLTLLPASSAWFRDVAARRRATRA